MHGLIESQSNSTSKRWPSGIGPVTETKLQTEREAESKAETERGPKSKTRSRPKSIAGLKLESRSGCLTIVHPRRSPHNYDPDASSNPYLSRGHESVSLQVQLGRQKMGAVREGKG
ncbi:hypothetical protein EVAR_2605_1 [Eumeta japonica]|uniref:Uncharacterized protein n=1 Tax=Eumeta variegata TaxID=151549 RepID=A0A4C1SLW4_EUMVA|nr:hypothetical protein EVAR_2605_1 [Eumeta japonica]